MIMKYIKNVNMKINNLKYFFNKIIPNQINYNCSDNISNERRC